MFENNFSIEPHLLVAAAPVSDLASSAAILDPSTPRAVLQSLASFGAARAGAGICVGEAAVLALHIVYELEVHAAAVAYLKAVRLACADFGISLHVDIVCSQSVSSSPHPTSLF